MRQHHDPLTAVLKCVAKYPEVVRIWTGPHSLGTCVTIIIADEPENQEEGFHENV